MVDIHVFLMQFIFTAIVVCPSYRKGFTAQRYASAVYSVVVCLCVCLSHSVLYQNG